MPTYEPERGRPLIPFGGGIDSIVTVDALSLDHHDATLCVVNPPGARFAAIEDAAGATGLAVRHIGREIDPLVRHSAEHGFLNGHVPVTAIITAAAVVAAVLEGRDRGRAVQRMVGLGSDGRGRGARRQPPVVER